MFGRRKIAALVSEFLGTGVLTLVFLSVQRSTIGVPYFVALAAGLTLIAALLVYGENSGAHLNPAVTLALWTARKVGTLAGLLYIVMQLLGAWAAYGIYTYFVNSSLQTIGGHYTGRVLVAEAIGTMVLAIGWGAAVYHNYKAGTHAVVIGLSYAMAIIIAAAVGIGIANPAVALGVRAWNIWGSMGWGTYVLGPILGAVLGVNLYGLLFAPSEAVLSSEAVVATTTEVAPSRPRATKAATTKSGRTTAKRKTSSTRRKR